jgi:hypothetical protein
MATEPAWNKHDVLARFEDGWTVECVRDRDDLMQESRLMRNCAGIIPASESLLSLRDPQGRPHLDVKLVAPGIVAEIAGKANGPIKPAYAERLRRSSPHLAALSITWTTCNSRTASRIASRR